MAVSPTAYRHSMPGELGEVLLVRAYRGVRVRLLFKLGELLPRGPLAQLRDNVDTASEPPGHVEQRAEQVWLTEQVAGEEHLLLGRPDEPARAGARYAIVSPVVTCLGVAPSARASAAGCRVSSAVAQATKNAFTVARTTSMTEMMVVAWGYSWSRDQPAVVA